MFHESFRCMLDMIRVPTKNSQALKSGSSTRSSSSRRRSHEQEAEREKDERTIFVDKIPHEITDVRKYFGRYGRLISSEMKKGKLTGSRQTLVMLILLWITVRTISINAYAHVFLVFIFFPFSFRIRIRSIWGCWICAGLFATKVLKSVHIWTWCVVIH